MKPIIYKSDADVKLIDSMGTDDSIIKAAQTSVNGGETDVSEKRRAGLINYLMRERHGTPFEVGVMTFYFHVPVFTSRQMVRHRIASVNELSGRYRELEPIFYMPTHDRPLVNEGSGAHPNIVVGSDFQYDVVAAALETVYNNAWAAYEVMIEKGIATELARSVLPVGIYTELHMTFNLRSLMNFLSLRVPSDHSKPQHEIAEVAVKMEELLKEKFPLVHKAFVANGRVAP